MADIVEEHTKSLESDFGGDSLVIKGISSFADLRDDIAFI